MDRVTISTTPQNLANLKKAHLDAGYEIVNEQSSPVNGRVSFQVQLRRMSPLHESETAPKAGR